MITAEFGLSLVRRRDDHWLIELLLLSCRVMGRNLGNALIGAIGKLAAADGLPLRGCYRPNGRNRQMQITYAVLGFNRVENDGHTMVYEHAEPGIIHSSAYIEVICPVRK